SFFLYYSPTLPHANNEGKQNGMEVPDLGQYANTDWPPPQKAHAAMISRLDSDIGRLMDLLKKLGLDNNTLVFFSSDNGPHREGGNDPDFNNSNGPLKGIKRDLTEGGIRVPFIARWPGKVAPGVSHLVGGFQDIMPTLAALAGASDAVPKDIDGLSVAPTRLGERGDGTGAKGLPGLSSEAGRRGDRNVQDRRRYEAQSVCLLPAGAQGERQASGDRVLLRRRLDGRLAGAVRAAL